MNQDEVTRTLQHLLDELETVEGASPEDVSHLEQLRAEIRGRLAGEPEGSESLVSRIRAVAERFEQDHPRLTLAVGQAADVLSNMGL